jgi:hypothetical protein
MPPAVAPAPVMPRPAPVAPAPMPAAPPEAPATWFADAPASVVDEPAAAPVDDDPWALPSFETAHQARPLPVPPARPPADQGTLRSPEHSFAAPSGSAELPGAVFARYATGVVPAPTREPMSAAATEAVAYSGSAAERGDDLWFLANEPQSSTVADENAEPEPSSTQTAVATVLVAMIVIGLVIVFLLLFTSFFR